MAEQLTCDWPMGTVWSGPKRCGRKAKYKVTSGPLCHIVTYVCGIHERSNRRDRGGSEALAFPPHAGEKGAVTTSDA